MTIIIPILIITILHSDKNVKRKKPKIYSPSCTPINVMAIDSQTTNTNILDIECSILIIIILIYILRNFQN